MRRIVYLVIGFSVLATAQISRALPIDVHALFNGDTKLIGKVNADLTPSSGRFYEKATFTFLDGWGRLDLLCDFRWYQIITDDTNPPPYGQGKVPSTPYVDPPSGGYDYQQTSGGADNDPFYENSDPGNYAYPNFSAQHVEGKNSWTDDFPGLNKNESVTFESYLVVMGKCIGENAFNVLSGFSWGIARDASGNYSKTDPASIASFDLTELNTAMANSGFAGTSWKAVTGKDLACCVPEPSSIALLAMGLLGMFMLHLRRTRYPVTGDGSA